MRNGVALDSAAKDKLRDIDKRLSTLSPQFSKNTLNATNEYEVMVREKDLEGLPNTVIEAAKIAARNERQW